MARWCPAYGEGPTDPAKAATLVWNGPLGAFELAPFDRGTVALAKLVANQTQSRGLVSIAGALWRSADLRDAWRKLDALEELVAAGAISPAQLQQGLRIAFVAQEPALDRCWIGV